MEGNTQNGPSRQKKKERDGCNGTGERNKTLASPEWIAWRHCCPDGKRMAGDIAHNIVRTPDRGGNRYEMGAMCSLYGIRDILCGDRGQKNGHG